MKGHDPRSIEEEYERAIAAASTSGFLQVEALANERAFRFHSDRGRRSKASAFLLEALEAYERWGASAKVRMLAQEHDSLLHTWSNSLRRWSAQSLRVGSSQRSGGPERAVALASSPSSSESLTEGLDVDSVMKASQAISSELLFPQFVANLIQIVMESAGAQRGVLVLKRGEGFLVEALGEVGNLRGPQPLVQPLERSDALCLAVAQQVLRTGSHVLMDDATASSRSTAGRWSREFMSAPRSFTRRTPGCRARSRRSSPCSCGSSPRRSSRPWGRSRRGSPMS